MKYIDHHAHMVSRTTDDYQAMAQGGIAQLVRLQQRTLGLTG